MKHRTPSKSPPHRSRLWRFALPILLGPPLGALVYTAQNTPLAQTQGDETIVPVRDVPSTPTGAAEGRPGQGVTGPLGKSGSLEKRSARGAVPAAGTKAKSAPGAAPNPGSKAPRFAQSINVSKFLRGNLHTHSNRSDGDSPPNVVYRYYREHGYSFVALTDHNKRTDPEESSAERRRSFVLLPGEEVTLFGAGKPVHVNALCTKETIGGGSFDSTAEALTWAVDRIKEQGGVALVNHPNFEWAVSATDLPFARGASLLEIWSGHPHVRTLGDDAHPSHEQLWTTMLDSGLTFAGVAVDDMHNLSPSANESAARPLQGWVEVFGREATEEAICEGLRKGRLYSSSGPRIARIQVKGQSFAVTLATPARVEVLGVGGAVLSDVDARAGQVVSYKLRGGERYVRARITDASGQVAFTQAYRVE